MKKIDVISIKDNVIKDVIEEKLLHFAIDMCSLMETFFKEYESRNDEIKDFSLYKKISYLCNKFNTKSDPLLLLVKKRNVIVHERTNYDNFITSDIAVRIIAAYNQLILKICNRYKKINRFYLIDNYENLTCLQKESKSDELGKEIEVAFKTIDENVDIQAQTKCQNTISEGQVVKKTRKKTTSTIPFGSLEVGDELLFGKYVLEGNKKGISWKIIQKNSNSILVISKNIIDMLKFYETSNNYSWKTSLVRKWLNEEFFIKAFNSKEKQKILGAIVKPEEPSCYSTNQGEETLDNVFLLSQSEVEKFFPNREERKCNAGKIWWGLRSFGLGKDRIGDSKKFPKQLLNNLLIGCVNENGFIVYYSGGATE